MLDPDDLAINYFNAARAEILARLSLREQVLFTGFATFGVVASLALSNRIPILFSAFPTLAVAFTLVLFRHHWLITDLSTYVNLELSPALGIETGKAQAVALPWTSPPAPVAMPLHWDAWLHLAHGRNVVAPKKSLRRILGFELFSAWLLIWFPGLGGLLFYIDQKLKNGQSLTWCNLSLTGNAVLLIVALIPYFGELKRLTFGWK
jgi:hypothetical protein